MGQPESMILKRLREKPFLKEGSPLGMSVVIRYVGPKGGPGMPCLYSSLNLLRSKGLERTVALITDGRLSGTIRGAAIGHISPEAAVGGPIALLRDGDLIRIDIPGQR